MRYEQNVSDLNDTPFIFDRYSLKCYQNVVKVS
jgi:hypothetical protein